MEKDNRPDFWDDLITQTLLEENLSYSSVDLSEYSWWCDRIDEVSTAYESGELTPLEARLEIFNVTVTLHSDILEGIYEASEDALDAQPDG
jgi:hypothetical protein